jgi:phage regulator Rha-like protein
MKELINQNQGSTKTIDSREVASMMDKRHDHLLRDIKSYVKVLEDSPDLGSRQFFIESNYSSGTRTHKCYLLTRKGCDLVANKMTGEKGVLFTATY